MNEERYKAIKPGDVIIRRGESCIGYTRGTKYSVERIDELGLLRIKDDDGEPRAVGRMGFACDDWHLFTTAWYDELQAGDKVMFRGYLGAYVELPDYLTVGKVYDLYWHTDDERYYVNDDNGEPENVVAADFLVGDWVRVAPTGENTALTVMPGKAYEDLEVGDVLRYMPDGRAPDRLTKGKEYEIVSMNGSYVIITADNGEKAGVSKGGYATGRWTFVSLPMGNDRVCKNVLPEDYASMLDFALETRDKEWYDDLMKKAKEPV